jgi:hypothetical protein
LDDTETGSHKHPSKVLKRTLDDTETGSHKHRLQFP